VFYRTGVIAGIGILDYFCSSDLDCDPMTFIYEYELDPYPLKVYRMWKYKRPTSRLSKVIVLHSAQFDYKRTRKLHDKHKQTFIFAIVRTIFTVFDLILH